MTPTGASAVRPAASRSARSATAPARPAADQRVATGPGTRAPGAGAGQARLHQQHVARAAGVAQGPSATVRAGPARRAGGRGPRSRTCSAPARRSLDEAVDGQRLLDGPGRREELTELAAARSRASCATRASPASRRGRAGRRRRGPSSRSARRARRRAFPAVPRRTRPRGAPRPAARRNPHPVDPTVESSRRSCASSVPPAGFDTIHRSSTAVMRTSLSQRVRAGGRRAVRSGKRCRTPILSMWRTFPSSAADARSACGPGCSGSSWCPSSASPPSPPSSCCNRFQRVHAAEDAVRHVPPPSALDAVRARIAEEAIPSSQRRTRRPRRRGTVRDPRERPRHRPAHALSTSHRPHRRRRGRRPRDRPGPPPHRGRHRAAGRRPRLLGRRRHPQRAETSNRQLFDKYRYLVDDLSDAVERAPGHRRRRGGGTPTRARGGRPAPHRPRHHPGRGGGAVQPRVPLAPEGAEGPSRQLFPAQLVRFPDRLADVTAAGQARVPLRLDRGSADQQTQVVDRTLAAAVASAATPRRTPPSLVSLSSPSSAATTALPLRARHRCAQAVRRPPSSTASTPRPSWSSTPAQPACCCCWRSAACVERAGRSPPRWPAWPARPSISRGELVDVVVEGPPETRVVAHGLGAAVASLRSCRRRPRPSRRRVRRRDPAAARRRPLGGVCTPPSADPRVMRDREQLQEEMAHQADPRRADHAAQPRRGARPGRPRAAPHQPHRRPRRAAVPRPRPVQDRQRLLGHVAGTPSCRPWAQRLRQRVRGVDVVARLAATSSSSSSSPCRTRRGCRLRAGPHRHRLGPHPAAGSASRRP